MNKPYTHEATQMHLISIVEDNNSVIKVTGHIATKDISKVRQQLEDLHTKAHKVVLIDLSQADLIDSTDIGILVFLANRLMSQKSNLVIISLAH